MKFTRMAHLLLLVGLTGCTEHIFQAIDPITTRVVCVGKSIDIDRAADILFVIDNSGSMAEEISNLADNASSSSNGSTPSRCDSTGFSTLKRYADNNRHLEEAQWRTDMRDIAADCGFIERLQLFDNKFHIGVITTDMNDCDRRSPPNTTVPQRGCLQPSPTGTRVLTWQTGDLANEFASIVRAVGINGSVYEKGLEASRHFLTPGHSTPAPTECGAGRDCSGDLADFYRETELNADGDPVETKLVVIYLTDEEDCSHGGAFDERSTEGTEQCYDKQEQLVDESRYVDFFRTLKTKPDLVSAAVIGGLYNTSGGMKPDGCLLENGQPSNACKDSRGNSNQVQYCLDHPEFQGTPTCPCSGYTDPDTGEVIEEPTTCCEADPARRYFNVVTQMSDFEVDTICSASYKETMIDIAGMVNETNVVTFPEAPADPNMVVVQIRSDTSEPWQDVPYCGTECTVDKGGWRTDEDNSRVEFLGEWAPKPGYQAQVCFLGTMEKK